MTQRFVMMNALSVPKLFKDHVMKLIRKVNGL